MATELNQIIINKISKALYDEKVASNEITSEMITNQVWLFTDDNIFTETEKQKLANISANAQVNVIEHIKVNGVEQTITSKEVNIEVPTKLGDLTNDIGLITNTVNNLTNYYLKTETYSKSEVNELVNGITSMNVQVVSALPTENISTTTIYLLAKTTSETNNVYDEYLYVNNTWEKIGDTSINLTNYVLRSELSTVATSGSYNDLSNKPTIPTVTNDLTDTLKSHYDSAYAHSQSSHAPANAQANVIEGVQVNGVDLTVSNKKVNITVPTVKTVIW